MLVLSREIGEIIMIGDDIEIMICDIRNHGTKIRIGIEAPKAVPVHRKEVYDIIQQERQKK